MIKKLTSVLASLTLAVGALVVAPAPQANAVGCWGDYCSGTDPSTTGCAADAFTVTAYQTGTYRMEVRWSPTCKTNWTRLTVYPHPWQWGATYGLKAVQDTGYLKQTTAYDRDYATGIQTYWTPQIYSPVKKVRGELWIGNSKLSQTGWA